MPTPVTFYPSIESLKYSSNKLKALISGFQYGGDLISKNAILHHHNVNGHIIGIKKLLLRKCTNEIVNESMQVLQYWLT